ncbi:MAG: hypothetical protein HQL30_12875 [Candidatus Omnitrophica bacterium]|nr:hypothetical protein [Candidatus Omnitrophota bacterium]
MIFLFYAPSVFSGDTKVTLLQDQIAHPLPSLNNPGFVFPQIYIQEFLKLDDRRVFSSKNKIDWIKANISTKTGMFLSFQVLPEEKQGVYSAMGELNSIPGIIERVIVENGLVIYDGAVGQIALTLSGGKEELALARKPFDHYWKGEIGNCSNIRAGVLNNFVYDPNDPKAVSMGRGGLFSGLLMRTGITFPLTH